jgi:uncharacterized protein (DUF2461 family)
MTTPDTDYLTPKFITVMADHDGYARWVAAINATDVMNAYRTGGVYIMVMLDEEGRVCIGLKPGRAWEATWSPPISLERR